VRPVLDFLRAALLVFVAAVLPAAHAQEQVEFDSLDVLGGKPVRLIGHWFAAPTPAASAPAIVLLHGCSGPFERSGQLGERMRSYAALLNAQGAHALVLDSLTPRGEKELCTQKVGARQVTQANRRLDALAALAWLSRRTGVDPRRLGLLGWSNGGSTVLAAVNTRHPAVAAAAAKAAFAVAFYPGCEAELKRGFESRTPLLILVGEADDWTPARLATSWRARPRGRRSRRSKAMPARTTASIHARHCACARMCPTG
jgi:dienelactone hydrolase